ncbi:MAG: MBL fold metallo-hydrolase [Sulfurovaceae bacterium]
MNQTEVTFWDVEHGNAAHIKTPNGRHIVIDLGIGSYESGREFSPLLHLKNNGIDQLDCVVITHPHLDHIDDILNFDVLSPKVLLRSTHLSKEEILGEVRAQDREKFDKYFEIDSRYNSPISNTVNDLSLSEYWGELKIKTFVSDACAHSNINNHSIIVVIEYVGIKVVFTGDNETCSYNELLALPEFKDTVKKADILLAAHHGRESGYHNDFVSLVNPRVTVVSDGRFGDTSATSRYWFKSRGWDVYKSDGSSSKRYVLTTRQDGEVVARFGYQNNTTETFLNIKIN